MLIIFLSEVPRILVPCKIKPDIVIKIVILSGILSLLSRKWNCYELNDCIPNFELFSPFNFSK